MGKEGFLEEGGRNSGRNYRKDDENSS